MLLVSLFKTIWVMVSCFLILSVLESIRCSKSPLPIHIWLVLLIMSYIDSYVMSETFGSLGTIETTYLVVELLPGLWFLVGFNK